MPTLLAPSQWRRSSRVGEAGKTEEWRMQLEILEVLRLSGAEVLPVGRLLDRDHALEQVGARGGVGHVAQGRLGMGIGVVGDRVAVQHFAAGDLRQLFSVAADLEERRANALIGERVQDFRRGLGGGPVVESQDHLMVGERDRLRIGLQADLEAALRADLGDPRGAELLGPASLRFRAPGSRPAAPSAPPRSALTGPAGKT